MPEKEERTLRAVFVYFAMPAAAIMVTAPYVANENARAQAEIMRLADEGRLAETLGVQWIEMSEDRLGAETLVLQERGRGTNRRRTYVLGMSGSGSEAEARFFRVLTFFEKVGALMSVGRVNPNDLAGYMREDACRWRDHLGEVRERSERAPSLDQARFEQLLHAITAVGIICGDAPNAAMVASMWRPVHIIDEAITFEDGRPMLTAVIRNNNLVPAATAALRVGARAHDGTEIGYWLVFPSDANIPANGEIAIRGSLPWPRDGIATGVALATSELDFAAIIDEQRFPNRGRQTWED